MKRLLIYNIIAIILMALCPFTTSAQTSLVGDVNADGKINAADLVELINRVNGKPSSHFSLENADMNQDSSIDQLDVKELAQKILHHEASELIPNYICRTTEAEEWTSQLPFMDAIWKDGAISAFTNEKGATVFLICDFSNFATYLLCPTPKGFCLAPYDPLTDSMSDHVVYYQRTETQSAIGAYEADWKTQTLRCDSCRVVSIQHASPLKQSLHRDPSMQGIYNEFANLFDDMSNGCSDLSNGYEVVEKSIGYNNPGLKPSLATKYLSQVFSGVSNEFRGYSLEVTASQVAIDKGTEGLVKTLINKNKTLDLISSVLGIVVNHIEIDWKEFAKTFKKNIHNTFPFSITPDQTKKSIEYIWRQRDVIASVPEPDIIHEQAYHVEVKVTDIKATSAVISGSYKEIYPEGSIIDMGYILVGPDGKQEVSAFNLPPMLIDNLEPDSQYEVYAYLSSASAPGGRYMSKPIKFVTKAEETFALSTDDIEFEPEGGSYTIDVYVPEGVTWFVTDVPAWWLDVSTTDNTITIKADETDEERSSTITLKAYYPNGKTKQFTIYVNQWGPDPDISDLDADIIFEGELEGTYDHNHWVNGEAHPKIEQDKLPIVMGFTMDDEGHANLSLVVEGGIYTFDMSDPVTAITMLTGELINGERNNDGWRYVLSSYNYEAKDDEVRMDWGIDGDWEVNQSGNTTSDVSYSIKGSGYSKNAGSIVISGLTTNSPVLDWFDATESETEYIYTYDYLDQKTHYKSHDKDSTMGRLQGHWNDDGN